MFVWESGAYRRGKGAGFERWHRGPGSQPTHQPGKPVILTFAGKIQRIIKLHFAIIRYIL